MAMKGFDHALTISLARSRGRVVDLGSWYWSVFESWSTASIDLEERQSLYSTTSCDRVVHGERLRHKRSGRSPSSRGCRPVPLASPPDGEAQTVISTATIEINR
uniref:Uncharacterized protein n=1 Tax=Coccidioides posadasii RMSCC 3488 TaxID=454284 RepID=A0A0J6EV78_COCPO|nr:hypothetical protein CPAG_00803 [Coccidioides posadasii RMSCC 3488]